MLIFSKVEVNGFVKSTDSFVLSRTLNMTHGTILYAIVSYCKHGRPTCYVQAMQTGTNVGRSCNILLFIVRRNEIRGQN